jgi:hypothetical protein
MGEEVSCRRHVSRPSENLHNSTRQTYMKASWQIMCHSFLTRGVGGTFILKISTSSSQQENVAVTFTRQCNVATTPTCECNVVTTFTCKITL